MYCRQLHVGYLDLYVINSPTARQDCEPVSERCSTSSLNATGYCPKTVKRLTTETRPDRCDDGTAEPETRISLVLNDSFRPVHLHYTHLRDFRGPGFFDYIATGRECSTLEWKAWTKLHNSQESKHRKAHYLGEAYWNAGHTPHLHFHTGAVRAQCELSTQKKLAFLHILTSNITVIAVNMLTTYGWHTSQRESCQQSTDNALKS